MIKRDTGPAAHRKEVGDVVAEGAVVGVLLDGHDLQRVVAQAADARQHLLGKRHVGVDLRSRHNISCELAGSSSSVMPVFMHGLRLGASCRPI